MCLSLTSNMIVVFCEDRISVFVTNMTLVLYDDGNLWIYYLHTSIL